MTGATRHAEVREQIEAKAEERAEKFVPETRPDLSGLTQPEREVFESVELQGYTPLELARVSDREASTIRTLLSRAREKVPDTEVDA